jgi:hypothetical protein
MGKNLRELVGLEGDFGVGKSNKPEGCCFFSASYLNSNSLSLSLHPFSSTILLFIGYYLQEDSYRLLVLFTLSSLQIRAKRLKVLRENGILDNQ